jgi:hypothetical protein
MPEPDARAPELDRRWRLARAAALGGVLGPGVDPFADEAWAIELAMSAARDAVLRRTYDHGLRLGRGFVRFHGGPVPGTSLGALLGGLTSPCLRGTWTLAETGDALLLARPACPGVTANTCDYWREAVAGLVHGLTEGLGHVRHASAAGGAENCLDVVHGAPEGRWRFAAIEPALAEALVAAQAALRLLAPDVNVRFLGVLEGVVQYERQGEGCGTEPGADSDQESFERVLGRFAPGMRFQDVSPRAVLDRAADATPTTP